LGSESPPTRIPSNTAPNDEHHPGADLCWVPDPGLRLQDVLIPGEAYLTLVEDNLSDVNGLGLVGGLFRFHILLIVLIWRTEDCIHAPGIKVVSDNVRPYVLSEPAPICSVRCKEGRGSVGTAKQPKTEQFDLEHPSVLVRRPRNPPRLPFGSPVGKLVPLSLKGWPMVG